MRPQDKARKMEMLEADHVRPLTQLIRSWYAPGRSFPFVDPEDGGVNAEVLFIQHTPSSTAVVSGFVSRENLDRTATRADLWLTEAGFVRRDYVRWNVVPYYISTPSVDGKATTTEVHDAAELYTKPFLRLLPRLKVIVFCGGKAQAQIRVLDLDGFHIISTYHCGARHPDEWKVTRRDFKNAYDLMMAARSQPQ